MESASSGPGHARGRGRRSRISKWIFLPYTFLAYDSCTPYNEGMDHSHTPFGRPLTDAEEREQLRSEIIAAENRFTAGLGIDMSKISRAEFVRQVRELSHRRHPELAPKKKG